MQAIALLAAVAAAGSCGRRQTATSRTLRIGFDDAPPYTLVGADGSPKGLAVELIQEAARRRNIALQWIKYSNVSSVDDLLVNGSVDLWPVVGLAQSRLNRIYIAKPWIENNFFLVSRKGAPLTSPQAAKGRRVAHGTGPLAIEMAHKFLGQSGLLPVRGFANLIRPVCTQQVEGAFMEARTLEAVLLDPPAECAYVPLKVSSVPNALSRAGIGASRKAAHDAEILTDEIISMAADGTFARTVDKWSSFSATETRSLVALQQTHERNTLFYRGLWALLTTCFALAAVAVLAFRSRGIAERARAVESSRVEILRQLAQGASLDEIVSLLNRSLRQCCPGQDCSLRLGMLESPAVQPGANLLPIVDSGGRPVGTIILNARAGATHAGLMQEEEKALDGIRQLAAIVAEHRMLHIELQRQARQDRLTGLANRAVFAEKIGTLTNPESTTEGALFFFDLDRFKQVNDRFGHAAGDIFLRQASERIVNCFGPADLVARLGGDEFAAVAPGANIAAASAICQAVIDAFSAPFLVEGARILGGISVGVSVYPADGETPADLQRSADAALYDAKNRGRNRFTVCSPEIRECAGSTLRSERLIRQALDRNWFELFYQPQMTADGRLVGMEALARIRHPEQGLIAAAEFIEIAEQAGLVTEIDAWVLQEAASQYAEWSRQGLEPVRIAFNVSRLDLSHAELFGRVMSALHTSRIGCDALQIELTETAAMLGGENSIALLGQLKAAGISLALDDFGCGYSSLSCLHGLPVDTVKIDKSFVRRMTADDGSASLVSAMVAAAKAFRMIVVAEGVETEEQMRFLSRLGCDVMQGYHISRPLNSTATRQLLVDRVSSRSSGPPPVVMEECAV